MPNNKRPQEFIKEIWKADLFVLEKGGYVGNPLIDSAYTYALGKLNDKYSNSFFDVDNNKIKNMYWDSIKESEIDILRNSLIISEEAYNRVYKNKDYDYASFKKDNKDNNKAKFGDYLLHGLKLHLEHLTPMKQSYESLLSLKLNEINDKNISEASIMPDLHLSLKERQTLSIQARRLPKRM